MEKTLNQHGKEVQTACPTCGQHPDESKKYKSWLRTVNTGATGVWTDIDLIKVQARPKGQYVPKAITDLTFAKSHSKGYLSAITDRWFKRDSQGKIFQGLASALNVPAYLVAYGEGQVSTLDIVDPDRWETYDLDEWAERVNSL